MLTPTSPTGTTIYRLNSPQSQPQIINRIQNPQSTYSPAIYQSSSYIRQQHIQQPSGMMSNNPSISFGGGTSNMKNPINSINSKTVTLQNGDFYEGDMNMQGQFQGYGRYYYIGKKHQYHGQFHQGRPHGRGQLYRNIGAYNGSNKTSIGNSNLVLVYDGDWRNGMKNGQGKYIYNSQNHYYQGPWVNDQRHGNQGTYVSPVGKYIGKWKNGRMDGRGQFFVNKNNMKYDGNFADNQFVNGLITYANNDQYFGAVKNGQRQDNQGRYLYNRLDNGLQKVRFVGSWRNDTKHDQSGTATVTYPNGDTLKGVYKNGRFVDQAQCMYQWTDGSMYKGWLKKVPSTNRGFDTQDYTFLKGFVKQANGKQYQV